MADIRVKPHPNLGILVCTDGHVFIPGDKYHKDNWTYGSLSSSGYYIIQRKKKNFLVHRLVAETFLSNPNNLPQVDHRNRIKTDNRLENLRYVSRSENQRNTSRNDRCEARFGIHTYENITEYNRRNIRDWYEKNKDAFNARRRKKKEN